jgi:hypothetical protein
MQKKNREINFGNELQFELKYCERCGGLWLRPVGGGQIYCVACGREMAQLPPVSHERRGVESARLPLGPRWGVDDSDVESFEEYAGLDVDAWGGVA